MTEQAAEVLALLAAKGWRLVTAESLTGGLLADAFVSVPGASAVFSGGVVSYDTAVKQSLLGVDGDLLARVGAVDPDVAIAMARGARRAVAIDGIEAEVGVSTTGVAGPDPADGQPVGTVFIGISSPHGDEVIPLALSGDRTNIRRGSVDAAVSALAAHLTPRP